MGVASTATVRHFVWSGLATTRSKKIADVRLGEVQPSRRDRGMAVYAMDVDAEHERPGEGAPATAGRPLFLGADQTDLRVAD